MYSNGDKLVPALCRSATFWSVASKCFDHPLWALVDVVRRGGRPPWHRHRSDYYRYAISDQSFESKVVFCLLLGCWICLLQRVSAYPGQSIRLSEPFLNAHWDQRDGLPRGDILDLEESPEGQLWILSNHGFRAFDGRRFFVPEGLESLADAALQRSAVDGRGHLWFSGAGSIHGFEPAANGGYRKTRRAGSDLVRDGQGWVWWRTGSALEGRCGTLNGSLPSHPSVGSEHPLLPSLWGARQGGVYRVEKQGDLWRGTLQGWTRIPGPLDPGARIRWCEVFEDPRGRLWMSILTELGEALLVVRDQETWRSPFGAEAARVRLARCFLATRCGEVLIGADHGLLYLFTDPSVAPRIFRVESKVEPISAIHEDGWGNWWVASEGEGLKLVDREPHQLLAFGRDATDAAGPPSRRNLVKNIRERGILRIIAVAVDPRGRLWAAAGAQGLLTREGDHLVPPANGAALVQGGVSVTSVLSTSRGLVLGGERLLMLLDEDGALLPGLDLSGHLGAGTVTCLAADSEEVIWVGTDSGTLLRIPADPSSTSTLALGGTISNLSIQGDRLWMIVGDQLKCRRGDAWVPIPADLESVGNARSLHVDDRGRLMVVGASGVAVMQGERVVLLGPRQGVFPGTDSVGFHDPRSGLWLVSDFGIQEIPEAWLDAALSGPGAVPTETNAAEPSGKLISFTTFDEVTPNFAHSANPIVLPSGEVALPSNKGVLLVRLESSFPFQGQPEFRIWDARIEKTRDRDGPVPLAEICVPRGAHLVLQLQGNLPAALKPVPVRYSLSQGDDAWVPWNPSEPLRIVAKGEGSFPLRLQARLPEGGWSAGTTSWIEVEAPPALSAAFRWAILAGFLTMLALMAGQFWRSAVHHRRIRMRALEGVQIDRVRIARALHDDLGNRLSEIQMLTEQTTFFVGPDEPSMSLITRIHARSVDATVALDNMVWLMRDVSEAATDLGRHIERLARDYLQVCSVELDFKLLAGSELEVGGWVRQLIVAATQELTRNAVRHGHATRVAIDFRVGSDWVTYRLEDNGVGFVVRDGLASGRGLSGLAGRIRDLGGHVSIVSEPGSSVIFLKVPRILT